MSLSDDALSEALRSVRLRACIYFVKDMAPPWGLDVPVTPNGPLHMALEGSCLIRHEDEEIILNAGDAVFLPKGSRHEVLDSSTTMPEPGPEVMQRLINNGATEPSSGSTRMLCGHFEWNNAVDHPLFRELPDLLIVRNVFKESGTDQFQTIINMIIAEINSNALGNSAIADRMGEVLFVSILRAWIVQQKPAHGVLATMNDQKLSRALKHIHENPSDDINLPILAQIAGMSRTSFAIHFRKTMGIPPAAYLTEWRMLHARDLLLQKNISATEIMDRVGYGSEAAFIRAFKRKFAVTPGKFRRSSIN